MARGFSSLPKERMREIASMGGRASQNGGRSHRWNAEEAAAAGRKGGAKVASDPDYMARIGKIGGLRRVARLRAEKAAAAREPAEQQAAESDGVKVDGGKLRDDMPAAAHDPPRPPPPEVRAPVQPAVVDPVEAAAKARADRRRLLIERGSAWHQQAAAYTASLPSTSPEQCQVCYPGHCRPEIHAALDEGAE